MKKHINPEFSFEVWINNDADSMADEIGSFDDNWMVSAGDLFDGMELPTDEPLYQYDEAA
ncbi:hypothetical protein F5984_25740 [Rudanella paleaurantiibacter]|uniref:Uncharacterized protein n=1 Tax=Rudanella paleaurantiibacter TaxID=2614655 RepID=A0A7J5TS99_9BACT|nr:hypothetical protein [Rudanella paleaurantiibacter]KAB7725726.1 hypothetical protein F5984_25740 [Rudanella paleaurantiibacter]